MRPIALIIILFLFLLTSCLFIKKDSSFVSCPDGFEKVSVVNHTNLDGCGFMLQKSDSTFYEAVNLPDSLKKEGKIICIKFKPITHQASICMSGQMIHLLQVR